MSGDEDEYTPLLHQDLETPINRHDYHNQFCRLVGVPPSDWPKGKKLPPTGPKTLYGRATRLRRSQYLQYQFTAALSNTLLLTQVILGAALTALGASESSHILITLFGATNTVIAGLVAYLKSRGQPMRAQMFKDDLERVCDEIENSEIMWLGISKGVLGYSEINTNDAVTVRSEVARLTRLYDRAVRNNTANNPDNYLNSVGTDPTHTITLRTPAGPQVIVPATPAGVQVPAVPTTVVAPAAPDPDESPASAPKPPPAPPKDVDKDKPKDDKKVDATPDVRSDPTKAAPTDKAPTSEPSKSQDAPAAPTNQDGAPKGPKPGEPGAVAGADDDEQAPATEANPRLIKDDKKEGAK